MTDPMAFGYGDLRFSWGDHICTIFQNREQQMAVMVPFMAHGLAVGQRCVWASPKTAAEEFRRALTGAGGDVPSLEASGQLLIIPDVDYYLQGGIFEPERTLQLAQTLYEDSMREGYSGIRATGDVSWLTGEPVDLDLWERYEHEFTARSEGKAVVTVCQYDQRRFSGGFVVAALHTHPIVILGETVCRNPFLTSPPEEFEDRREVH
jgi:hypothetical protein